MYVSVSERKNYSSELSGAAMTGFVVGPFAFIFYCLSLILQEPTTIELTSILGCICMWAILVDCWLLVGYIARDNIIYSLYVQHVCNYEDAPQLLLNFFLQLCNWTWILVGIPYWMYQQYQSTNSLYHIAYSNGALLLAVFISVIVTSVYVSFLAKVSIKEMRESARKKDRQEKRQGQPTSWDLSTPEYRKLRKELLQAKKREELF